MEAVVVLQMASVLSTGSIPDVALLIEEFSVKVENRKNQLSNLRSDIALLKQDILHLSEEIIDSNCTRYLGQLQQEKIDALILKEQDLSDCQLALQDLRQILHSLKNRRMYFGYL